MKYGWGSLLCLLLSACVYSETPDGRYARIDLPVESQTTVNKTVTINAPPGTTVIYGDVTPVSAYTNYPTCRYRDCRYPRPVPRPVYRLEGNGGSVEQRYESQYLRY